MYIVKMPLSVAAERSAGAAILAAQKKRNAFFYAKIDSCGEFHTSTLVSRLLSLRVFVCAGVCGNDFRSIENNTGKNILFVDAAEALLKTMKNVDI